MKRAVDKGYVTSVKIDTFRVPYLVNLKVKGKDTTLIMYKDSIVPKLITEYKTKWMYRFDNKRFADSLAHIRAMYEDSLRNALKSQKVEARKDNKTKKQTRKVIQSENKNGFADAVKWVALSILGIGLIIFLFIVIRALKRYILLNG
jgi:translation initiation factor RLI1